jgi:hypothetical protein
MCMGAGSIGGVPGKLVELAGVERSALSVQRGGQP